MFGDKTSLLVPTAADSARTEGLTRHSTGDTLSLIPLSAAPEAAGHARKAEGGTAQIGGLVADDAHCPLVHDG